MKFILIYLLFNTQVLAQQFYTNKGKISFFSEAPLEDISAVNENVSTIIDIQTVGHVFSLHLSNSRGMNEQAFLTQTTGQWLDGDIYFGFNISRVFL